MNVLETEWWSMALPPEWWAEAEGDSILVGDRDDVGCIEISILRKNDGVFTGAEIEAIARDASDSVQIWRESAPGEFSGLASDYVEEDVAIREWYVAADATLLFMTYSCDLENKGMDDAAVDELLDTLLATSAS
ncbi:MAG: hypothetical protein ACI9NT_000694 [Bacteroidia bacterium]|jgi:hypothetical protein